MAVCTTKLIFVVHGMMEHLSSIAQSAYHDLLRSLKDDQATQIGNAAHKEIRGTRSYWYETVRTGTTVRKRYIGEDSHELAARLATRTLLAETQSARNTHRTRLVRLLRAEGLRSTDIASGSLYAALAKAGVFRLGGTIVGTHAFRHYEGELGIRFGVNQMAQTDDLDIAQFERLSLVIDDVVETPLADTFKDFDFEPQPTLSKSVWRWRQTRSNTLIEFLTPSFRDDEDIRDLPALGVSAQSLHFLNYLIAGPIPAAALYRSGVLVQIPRPERYAIHKLIVADRRRGGPDAIKSLKDRLQATFLIRALAEDRPDDLREAYDEAVSSGPAWRDHIARSLARLPEAANILQSL